MAARVASRKAVVRHRFRLVERLDGQARFGVGDFEGDYCGTMRSRSRGVGWARSGPGSPSTSAEPPRAGQARAEEAEELSLGLAHAGVGCEHARVRPWWVHRTRLASRSAAAARRGRDASLPPPGCPRASTSAQPAARAPPPASTHRRPSHRPKARPKPPSEGKAQVTVRKQGCGRAQSGRRLVRLRCE